MILVFILFYFYRVLRVFWVIKITFLANFLYPIYMHRKYACNVVIKHILLCLSVTLHVL